MFLGSSRCIPELAQPSKSKRAQLETLVSLHAPGPSLRVLHGDTWPGLSRPRSMGVLLSWAQGEPRKCSRLGKASIGREPSAPVPQDFGRDQQHSQRCCPVTATPSPTSCCPAGTGSQAWATSLPPSIWGRDVPPTFSPGRRAVLAPSWPAACPPQGPGGRMLLVPFAHVPAARHGRRWPQARGVCVSSPGLKVCVSPGLAPAEEDKCKHCGQWDGRRLSGAQQWKNSRCVTKAR